MKLKYAGKIYDCVSATKEQNRIIIHTGNFTNDGKEIIYNIYGDIDFDAVIIEDGAWSNESEQQLTDAERIAQLEEALEMLLSGVTE